MFYLDTSQMEQTLRFGDVIQDIPICFPVISNPSSTESYYIQVSAPAYAVVLSPCCSISDKVLSIAPLLHLPGALFSNPYLAEDPKRINIRIPASKSLPLRVWDTMDPSEKAARLSKEDGYVFLDFFIYDEHPLFVEYSINRKDGNIRSKSYMIDFRTCVHVQCDKILNPKYTPGSAKVLQLSVEVRDLLRKKIGSFYQRVPDEDASILVS